MCKRREIEYGTRVLTMVLCIDEPGPGGACHEYVVVNTFKLDIGEPIEKCSFATIDFQKGPVKENGVNGIHNEDLLVICVDRLEHFQKGPYACRENALALTKIQEALHWLNHRTADRNRRDVEGTSEY